MNVWRETGPDKIMPCGSGEMVVLETRLGLLHQPRSSADGSAATGRLQGRNLRGRNWQPAATAHPVISRSFMGHKSCGFGNSELTLQELLLPTLEHFLVRVIPIKQLEDPSDDPARDNLRVGSQL